MRVRFAFAAATLLLAVPALAQHEPPTEAPKKVIREVYAPNEVIDMDGAKIYGEKWGPSGISVTTREGETFGAMIQERVHFKGELVKSARITVNGKIKASETEIK
jgi:hypothetical protein